MTPCRAACLAFLSASLWAAPVIAQTRSAPIPKDAKAGHIRHVEEMAVTVSRKPMQLAAGAIIRDQRNLIIVPVSIPREGAWLFLAEPGRACLARLAAKGWASVHNVPETDPDLLIERERNRAGGERLPSLVLTEQFAP